MATPHPKTTLSLSLTKSTLPPPSPSAISTVYQAYKDDDPSRLQSHPDPATRLFSDAMSIRHSVFMHEQRCPLSDEIDSDDARSWHFTAYEGRGGTAVATLRVVPEPHGRHPLPGSVDGVGGGLLAGQERRGEEGGARDVGTRMHDGREGYVKVGRVATLEGWRGRGVGGWLVREVFGWMRENWGLFGGKEGEWRGLLMLHSQEWAVPVYRRYGFEVDEELGTWEEVGITHVAMWMRLKKDE